MTFLRPILAALACVAVVACSPATTRALCETSGVALDVAHPVNSAGKLATTVGKFIRSMFCPKTSPLGGATDRLLPTSVPTSGPQTSPLRQPQSRGNCVATGPLLQPARVESKDSMSG